MSLQPTFVEQLDATEAAVRDARYRVMSAEIERLNRRAVVTRAETKLAMARNTAMASPEAGTNDHQRRNFADSRTADQQAMLNGAESDLRLAEIDLLTAKADLADALDARRTLEFIIRLTIAGLEDAVARELVQAEPAYATEDADAFTF